VFVSIYINFVLSGLFNEGLVIGHGGE